MQRPMLSGHCCCRAVSGDPRLSLIHRLSERCHCTDFGSLCEELKLKQELPCISMATHRLRMIPQDKRLPPPGCSFIKASLPETLFGQLHHSVPQYHAQKSFLKAHLQFSGICKENHAKGRFLFLAAYSLNLQKRQHTLLWKVLFIRSSKSAACP